jgi:4-hydroxy-2-oxoheptanedioate aldolase
MSNRINKAIQLLENDQPIYYVGNHSGDEISYESGKRLAKTFADYINVGMEHGSFDMPGLDAFMQGLVDGGPTNSGHRTPAVIVEAPVLGSSAEVILANAWQFNQILARGVHGIILCHAETPDAVRTFVEVCRYAHKTLGVGYGLGVGRRGQGGQGPAAMIWGTSPDGYIEKADVWPLDPNGELMLGLKIENKRALSNVELTTRVPGIAFAEMGPGDMSLSFGYSRTPDGPYPEELQEARDRVFTSCKAAGIKFLESYTPENAAQKIDEGVRITGAAGDRGDEVAAVGRAHVKRTMPV